jgi:ADP-ribose pyrophosphatase YjhB (NUDIX family)
MLIIRKRPLPVRIAREIFYFIYTLLEKTYNKCTNPKTYGVKVVIENTEGKFLLVRVGYGAKKWAWPGGKVDRGEASVEAARRELREESGIQVDTLHDMGTKAYRWEGKQDTVYFFAGSTTQTDLIIDGQEIIDAGWFDRASFPEPLSTTVADALRYRSG